MDGRKYSYVLPDAFLSDRGGKKTEVFHAVVSFGAVGLSFFQMLQAAVNTNSSIHLYTIHVLTTVLLMVLVSIGKLIIRPEPFLGKVLYRLLVAILVSGTCLYLWIYSGHLEVDWPWISNADIVVGLLLFFAVSATTWFTWGPLLSLIGVVGILYFIYGNYVPGLFGHAEFTLAYAVSYLGMSLQTGMFWLVPLSITVIFPLMVFGCVIRATNATEVFNELMKAAGRVSKIAPVYTCVAQSGVVGMVTGAPNANVVLVGSVTIPAMKKIGLRAETAGGLESLASTGSQIVPPIMGLAAFVMAQLIGVSYVVVMIAAIWPSILYYGAMVVSAYFVSMNDLEGIEYEMKETIDWEKVYRLLPTFFIPLIIVVYFLFVGYSALYASALATLMAIVLSQLQGKFRPALPGLLKGFSEGAILGSEVAVILLSVGFLGQALVSTGVALRLSQAFAAITGGSLLLSLSVLMVVSIAIGMGAPTVVAYVLCAIAVVPAVQDLGVTLLAAHFFAFYFSTFCHITPPVAGAVVTACQIAKSKYTATALQACRLSWPLFLVPFIFVKHPEFLEPSKMTLKAGFIILAYFISVINGASCVWNGEPRLRLGWIGRGIIALATIAGILFILKDEQIYLLTAIVATLVGWGIPVLHKLWANKRVLAQ